MVSRIETEPDGERDNLTRQDAVNAVNYITETVTSTRSQLKSDPRLDDLIVSLANAHENRRARQVTEWERMRQQKARSAA